MTATEYHIALPDETLPAAEIESTQRVLEPLGTRPTDKVNSHPMKFRKGIQDKLESDS